jgi:hypothetical protein
MAAQQRGRECLGDAKPADRDVGASDAIQSVNAMKPGYVKS